MKARSARWRLPLIRGVRLWVAPSAEVTSGASDDVVGLDLYKRYITACALDDAGTVVAEPRRLPADDTTLLG